MFITLMNEHDVLEKKKNDYYYDDYIPKLIWKS